MQPKKIGDKIRFRPSVCMHEDGRAQLRTGTVVWIHPRGYFVIVQYQVNGILGQGGTTLQECIYLPENDSRELLTDDERYREYKTWHERKTIQNCINGWELLEAGYGKTQMMDFLREGDILYIVDFSRLSRSLKDLLDVVDTLDGKGVHLVSMKENIDTGTPTGRLMLSMLGAINEFERTNMLERQREGIAIAKRNGIYKGRKKKTLPDIAEIYHAWATREKSKSELAQEHGVSRPTMDKLLKEYERDVLAKRKGTV